MSQAPMSSPEVIPYATPIGAVPNQDVWQQGANVVVRKNGTLPARCPRCNAPVTDPPKAKTFYWHNPALYLLILAGVLIYAIVALIVREKGLVYIHMCRKHRTQQLLGQTAGWVLGIGGVIGLIAGAAKGSGPLAIAGAVAFFVGINAAIVTRGL